ncbi:MAG: hypothetical protein JW996_02560 [Candidatus Cloacimonetes bacterium]|nr:hypothetical protein [Candidatus Cloacimonadota bacterium]
MRLKSYGYVKLNDRELSNSEFSDLRAAFKNLKSTVYSFNMKPDLILYCYDDIDDKGADMFCIFLKDELIYEGDYFYAWADEMKGLKSNCYRLNEDTFYLLQSLSGK